MLRRIDEKEALRRASKRLRRNKSLWWRPEIVRLSVLEGKFTDLLSIMSMVQVNKEIDYMLSVLTEGGWISMDLEFYDGDLRDASIRYPLVLSGRRVSKEELEEFSRKKYEAVLRFRLAD